MLVAFGSFLLPTSQISQGMYRMSRLFLACVECDYSATTHPFPFAQHDLTHSTNNRHASSNTSVLQSKLVLSQRLVELTRNSTLDEVGLRDFLQRLYDRFFSQSPQGTSGIKACHQCDVKHCKYLLLRCIDHISGALTAFKWQC